MRISVYLVLLTLLIGVGAGCVQVSNGQTLSKPDQPSKFPSKSFYEREINFNDGRILIKIPTTVQSNIYCEPISIPFSKGQALYLGTCGNANVTGLVVYNPLPIRDLVGLRVPVGLKVARIEETVISNNNAYWIYTQGQGSEILDRVLVQVGEGYFLEVGPVGASEDIQWAVKTVCVLKP